MSAMWSRRLISSTPEVRQLLGYPAGVRARQPAYPDEADSYLDDGILDAVIVRGPIYRPDLE